MYMVCIVSATFHNFPLIYHQIGMVLSFLPSKFCHSYLGFQLMDLFQCGVWLYLEVAYIVSNFGCFVIQISYMSGGIPSMIIQLHLKFSNSENLRIFYKFGDFVCIHRMIGCLSLLQISVLFMGRL